ncbi:MAG TPA: DNA polymerase IV [Bacillales bacterium]|nr:DNA polymerase IV [Bacillales bacterium]
MGNSRVIFHVDMNCFYASVEIALNPKLKGKPLAIAGDETTRHGIVVTSSYEARAFGVKTTMTVAQAKRLCPTLIVMQPNFERYRRASAAIFQLLRRYTPLVQRVSIDEGYLDVTDVLQGSPLALAKQIQDRMQRELRLPCSIGIAPNKYLAKTASDMKKPSGITVLRKRDVPHKLWPLTVGNMHGVGAKTEEKLNRVGIVTVGDLAKAEPFLLKSTLGINGPRLKLRANGIDQRPVDPEAESEFKSIGNSTTLPADTTDKDEIHAVLKKLALSVSRRMKRKNCVAWNVQLMIRYNNRKTITRSQRMANPVDADSDLFAAGHRLMQQHWSGRPVRLLGITAHELENKEEASKQLDLFSYPSEEAAGMKQEALDEALNHIRAKYGESVIKRGNNS